MSTKSDRVISQLLEGFNYLEERLKDLVVEYNTHIREIIDTTYQAEGVPYIELSWNDILQGGKDYDSELRQMLEEFLKKQKELQEWQQKPDNLEKKRMIQKLSRDIPSLQEEIKKIYMERNLKLQEINPILSILKDEQLVEAKQINTFLGRIHTIILSHTNSIRERRINDDDTENWIHKVQGALEGTYSSMLFFNDKFKITNAELLEKIETGIGYCQYSIEQMGRGSLSAREAKSVFTRLIHVMIGIIHIIRQVKYSTKAKVSYDAFLRGGMRETKRDEEERMDREIEDFLDEKGLDDEKLTPPSMTSLIKQKKNAVDKDIKEKKPDEEKSPPVTSQISQTIQKMKKMTDSLPIKLKIEDLNVADFDFNKRRKMMNKIYKEMVIKIGVSETISTLGLEAPTQLKSILKGNTPCEDRVFIRALNFLVDDEEINDSEFLEEFLGE